jgi:hypothetical protein
MKMITYELKITKIGKLSAPVQGLEDVVSLIDWQYVASSGETWVAQNGRTVLPAPNPEEFIPFNEITHATVVAWVNSRHDFSKISAELNIELAAKLQPTIVETAPPWVLAAQ